MDNFTNCTIEGFITDNAVYKIKRSGTSILTCELAIQHYSRPDERPRVSFIAVELWKDLADKYKDELKKGKRIQVSGSLRQDRWGDERGKISSRLKIVVNEVKL